MFEAPLSNWINENELAIKQPRCYTGSKKTKNRGTKN
jgi:hypothetical protein